MRQFAVAVDGLGADQAPVGDRALEQAARRERVPVLEAALGEDSQYVPVTPDDPAFRIPEGGWVGAGAQCSAGCSASAGPRLKTFLMRLQ
jgi:hypothetical protein